MAICCKPFFCLRQICANLIGTSWHLVTQHATSVTVSIIKIRVNKLHPCLGAGGYNKTIRVLIFFASCGTLML